MIPLSQVPTNKQLLWYYDDEMTHDLIQIQTYIGFNYNVLVERAVVNNVIWADNYSTALFNVLLPLSTVKQAVPLELATVGGNLTVNLPPCDCRVTFSFLHDEGDIIDDFNNEKIRIIKRHHYNYITGGQIKFKKTILKHSLVISCTDPEYDLAVIKQQIHPDYLYDNIDNLGDDDIYDYPDDLIKLQKAIYDWQFKELKMYDFNVNRINEGVDYPQGGPPVTVFTEVYIPIIDILSNSLGWQKQVLSDQPQQHGVLIYAQPQYIPIIGQGQNNNLIFGNPLLQVIQQWKIVNEYNNQPSTSQGKFYRNIYEQRLDLLRFYDHPFGYGITFSLSEPADYSGTQWQKRRGQNRNHIRFSKGVENNSSFIKPIQNALITFSFIPYINVVSSFVGNTDASINNDYNYFIGGSIPITYYPTLREQTQQIGVFNWIPAQEKLSQFGIPFRLWNPPVWLDIDTIIAKIAGLSLRTPIFRHINKEEIIEEEWGHWLKGININEFLDNEWLVKREKWQNRFTTIQQVTGINKSIEIDTIDFLTKLDNNIDNNSRDLLYNKLRNKWGINFTLNALLNQVKSIFDYKIYFTEAGRQVPDDDTLKILLIKELLAMNDSLRIQEIHGLLGCTDHEFMYYEDEDNNEQFTVTSVAWLTDKLAKAWGIMYNPDGKIRSVRQRKRVDYNNQGQVTIPEGWARGQFSVNKGDGADHNPNDKTRQNGGKEDEERLGIVYQNRCNKYENFEDDKPENNVLKRGDIVLCENLLQYFESYLEDLDKGLNWQEMGTGILPSADSTGFCNYEGMGTLLAEVAYMISQLSSNIYETHNLSLMTYNNSIEVFKALGVPTGSAVMKIDTGEEDQQVEGETQKANMIMLRVADDAPSLTSQLYNLLANLSLIIGAFSSPPEEEELPPQ